jgi:hypothetical protein
MNVLAMLLTAVSSHLLTIIERALIAAEPQMVADIEAELSLLISKLESFIQKKSPTASAVVTPILNSVDHIADASLEAAGNAAIGIQTPQSSN